jgi:hypothetical protein
VIDPRALLIWETKSQRIVVGRSFAYLVLSLFGSGSLITTTDHWVPVLEKLFGK